MAMGPLAMAAPSYGGPQSLGVRDTISTDYSDRWYSDIGQYTSQGSLFKAIDQSFSYIDHPNARLSGHLFYCRFLFSSS